MAKVNPPTLCWDCKKAVGRCSWSSLGKDGKIKYQPVPGWDAEETSVNMYGDGGDRPTQSYRVISCPEFEPDEEEDL